MNTYIYHTQNMCMLEVTLFCFICLRTRPCFVIFCGNNLHRAFAGILTHVVLLFLPMAVSWPPFHTGFAQAGSTTAQELPRGGKWAFMFTFAQAIFCFCVGYFSYYCDKTPDRSNLRKECWLWLTVWSVVCVMVGRDGNSSIRHLGHILIQEA